MENEDNGVMIDPTNERAKAVEVSKSPPEEHHAPHQGTMRSSREGLLASYLQPSEANGSVIGIAACGNRRICLIRLSSLVSWLIINIFSSSCWCDASCALMWTSCSAAAWKTLQHTGDQLMMGVMFLVCEQQPDGESSRVHTVWCGHIFFLLSDYPIC